MSVEVDWDDQDEVREHLRSLLVRALLRQWRAWARALEAGKDLAALNAKLFLAGSRSARENLARRFFEKRSMRGLADLSDAEVVQRVGPWMEAALDFAVEETSDSDQDARELFKAIAGAPYVVVLPDNGPYVQPFPDPRVLYGDLYEITCAGCVSAPSRIDLLKTTGEPFSSSERRSAWVGMREDFNTAAGASDDEDSPQINLIDWEDDVYRVSALGEPGIEDDDDDE